VQEQLRQKNRELEEAQLSTQNLNLKLEETVLRRTDELFKSREHFKYLADNMPAIIWTVDDKGTLDYFNNRWLEYTGGATLLPDPFSSFIHPEDKLVYLRLWQDAMRTGSNFTMIHRLRRASDGKYKWHNSQAIPYKDSKGNVMAWFGISTDIDAESSVGEER
jgi:two-component system CheB/CheR fusion protein